MEQQGGTEEFRREEALMALATLATYDPQFLNGVRADLDSTLWRYGFALSPQEMQEARDFLTNTTDLSDEDFIAALREDQIADWR